MNRLSVFAGHVFDRITSGRQRTPSGLDFKDAYPPGGVNFTMFPYRQMPEEPATLVKVFPKPLNLQRNKTERHRLQQIMQMKKTTHEKHESASDTWYEKLRHRFINEGGRRTFFAVWVLLHAMVFAFGYVHHSLKGQIDLLR